MANLVARNGKGGKLGGGKEIFRNVITVALVRVVVRGEQMYNCVPAVTYAQKLSIDCKPS